MQEAVGKLDEPTVAQVRALLRPLSTRDVAYQIEMRHEIPDRVLESGASIALLDPDLVRGFRGRSLPSITGRPFTSPTPGARSGVGSSRTSSSRQSSRSGGGWGGGSDSTLSMSRPGTTDADRRRWSARERRERVSRGVSVHDVVPRHRSVDVVVPSAVVTPKVKGGLDELLQWMDEQDSAAHLMFFKELIPCVHFLTSAHHLAACTLLVVHAAHKDVWSGMGWAGLR
jgi:hypothetical protein